MSISYTLSISIIYPQHDLLFLGPKPLCGVCAHLQAGAKALGHLESARVLLASLLFFRQAPRCYNPRPCLYMISVPYPELPAQSSPLDLGNGSVVKALATKT